MYNFQTLATSHFVPIEGQLVVFLALMGQMLSMHSRDSLDHVRSCTIERTDVPMSVRNPQGPLRCPNVNLTEPVWYTYGILQPREHRVMPTSGPGRRTWETVRTYGPWEVRKKSHAYGRFMGYLCSLESLESVRLSYGFSTVHVWATQYGARTGPYGCLTGL